MQRFIPLWKALAVLLLLLAGAGRASALNFGNVEVGRTVALTAVFDGFDCNGPITYAITGANAGDFQVEGPSNRVSFESVPVTVRFTPSALGSRTATLFVNVAIAQPSTICTLTSVLTGYGIPPEIECPDDITRVADQDQCGIKVFYRAPIAIGNAGPIVCMPPPGSFFPVGTTTVKCTSASGATCSFEVTVTDRQRPKINGPDDFTVYAAPGKCSAAVNYTAAATDNCPGVVLDCRPPSGSIFPVGSTLVRCVAADSSGNQDSHLFTVTVKSTQAPSITCPANITRNNDPGKCSAVVTYPPPTVSDNCPGVTTVTCSPPSGSAFPVGTIPVTCTAADASGNTSSCSFTVTVKDTEPLTITCPPSVMLPQDAGMRGATFHPDPAQAQDNCAGVVATGTRSDGIPITDTTYPAGTTTITWTATDTSGNQATCTQTVSVHDSQIVGVVALDTNGNHWPDPPQEPRLKGVTIELRDAAAEEFWAAHPQTKKPEPLATTQTNEVGNFSFPVAPPGVYDVVVKLLPGQTISALFPGPSNQAQIVTVNGEQRLRVTMHVGDTAAGLGILLQ